MFSDKENAKLEGPEESWINKLTDEEICRELCEIEDGLSEWEVDFVDSINKQNSQDGKSLTGRQRKKAEEILQDREE